MPPRPPQPPHQARTATLAASPRAGTLLGPWRHLLLASYWFSLSFQGGALLGVAIPAQVATLASKSQAFGLLGLIGGTSALFGMLAQPIAGVLSDLTPTRWGRRRSYLLGGALIDVIGLAIMARATTAPTLLAGSLLASVGSNISAAAYQAYLPDQVPPSQFGEASGYIGAVTMLGTVASFGLSSLLVAPGSAAPFYVATLLIVVIGALIPAWAFPEAVVTHARERLSWRRLWLEPWRHGDFTLVFATRSMVMLALYTLFTFVEYYVRDVLRVTQFVQGAALVAALATLAALGGGILTGILSDRVGRRAIVCIASVLMGGALCVLAFVHRLGIVLTMGVIFGIALGAYSAVDWALSIDVLPDQRFAAKDLGLWSISSSLPQTVAPFVGGGVLLALTPYGAGVGYGVLFLGAALCTAVSGGLVWRIKSVR